METLNRLCGCNIEREFNLANNLLPLLNENLVLFDNPGPTVIFNERMPADKVFENKLFPPPKYTKEDCKININSILTKAVNTKYILKRLALNSQKFQYLVQSIITKIINLYKIKNNMREKDILFIYKGGTTFSIYSEKITGQIKSQPRFNDLLRSLITKTKSSLGKSDSDYSLIINPNLPNFDQVYKDCNKLIYFTLLHIRSKLVANSVEYFGRNFGLFGCELRNILEEINTTIREKCTLPPEEQSVIPEEERFNFIVTDIFYFGEGIDSSLPVPPSTKDFIIYKNPENNSQLKFLKSPMDIPNRTDPDDYTHLLESNIQLSINETNHFGTSSFCLQRLKVSFLCVCENLRTHEFIHKWFQGELVDVSIPKQDDSNLRHIYESEESLNFLVAKENFEISDNGAVKEIDIYMYSLEGLYIDLLEIIFPEHPVGPISYPWSIKKWEVRIARICLWTIYVLYKYYSTNYDGFNAALQEIKGILLDPLSYTDEQYRRFYGTYLQDVNLQKTLHPFLSRYLQILRTLPTAPTERNNYERFNVILSDYFSDTLPEDTDFDVISIEETIIDEFDMMANEYILMGGYKQKSKSSFKHKYFKYLHKIQHK
jgi:hypothetical protein